MSRKGPLARYFRWWRGQDLNLRPSGYEISDRNLSPYHCVPDCALLQGFRQSLYARRDSPYTPVTRRTVEEAVEASDCARSFAGDDSGPPEPDVRARLPLGREVITRRARATFGFAPDRRALGPGSAHATWTGSGSRAGSFADDRTRRLDRGLAVNWRR